MWGRKVQYTSCMLTCGTMVRVCRGTTPALSSVNILSRIRKCGWTLMMSWLIFWGTIWRILTQLISCFFRELICLPADIFTSPIFDIYSTIFSINTHHIHSFIHQSLLPTYLSSYCRSCYLHSLFYLLFLLIYLNYHQVMSLIEDSNKLVMIKID